MFMNMQTFGLGGKETKAQALFPCGDGYEISCTTIDRLPSIAVFKDIGLGHFEMIFETTTCTAEDFVAAFEFVKIHKIASAIAAKK